MSRDSVPTDECAVCFNELHVTCNQEISSLSRGATIGVVANSANCAQLASDSQRNIHDNTPAYLSCGHVFCAKCVKTLTTRQAPHPAICPLCRKAHITTAVDDGHDSFENEQAPHIHHISSPDRYMPQQAHDTATSNRGNAGQARSRSVTGGVSLSAVDAEARADARPHSGHLNAQSRDPALHRGHAHDHASADASGGGVSSAGICPSASNPARQRRRRQREMDAPRGTRTLTPSSAETPTHVQQAQGSGPAVSASASSQPSVLQLLPTDPPDRLLVECLVQEIAQMGFSEQHALAALRQSDWEIGSAVGALLDGAIEMAPSNPLAPPLQNHANPDRQSQSATSRVSRESRPPVEPLPASHRPHPSWTTPPLPPPARAPPTLDSADALRAHALFTSLTALALPSNTDFVHSDSHCGRPARSRYVLLFLLLTEVRPFQSPLQRELARVSKWAGPRGVRLAREQSRTRNALLCLLIRASRVGRISGGSQSSLRISALPKCLKPS